MNWLAFIAEIIKAIAWPITVVVVLVILRDPVSRLLPLLTKLKYKDLELDFEKRLQEAATEVPPQLPRASSAAEDKLVQLAADSPRAAILEAWLRVERAALEFAESRGIKPGRDSQIVTALARSNVLDAWQVAVLKDLRSLRNSAAHVSSFEPSTDSAAQYVRLALELEQTLKPAP